MPVAARPDRTSAVQFIKWAAGASLLLSLFQLLLGGDPVIILLCLLSEAVCLFPVYLYGLGRTVGILYIGVWLAFSFSALLGKTILFQPIDSNLFNPILTFCVTLAGSLALTIAAMAAYLFKPLQNNAVPPLTNPGVLRIISYIFTVIGIGVFLIATYIPKSSLVYNIAIQLSPFFIYAYICEIARTLIVSNKNRIFSLYGVFLTVLSLYFGLSGNSKTGILQVGLAFILCIFSFRARLKWPILVGGAVTLIFLSEFIFPAVHIVRNYRDRLNPFEISLVTAQTAANLMIGDKETTAMRDALVVDAGNGDPDAYQNVYFGSKQIWLDRATNTGFIDAVARRVDFGGPFLGAHFILDQTFGFLPRQFDPNKTTTFSASGGDRVTQAFGLTARDQLDYATVPMPIELYVAGGFSFIFIITIPLIFLLLMEINFIAFEFQSNIWSVGLILTYGMLFYAGTYDMYIFLMARQIPANALIIAALILASTAIHTGIRTAARADSGNLPARSRA
jgi:hypothetical protein